MKEELKPCPFCGGEAKIIEDRHLSGQPYYWICCSKCKIEQGKTYSSKYYATHVWNTRVPKSVSNRVIQYTVPHYRHCIEYKEFTGTCMAKFRALGLSTRSQCKPFGCRTCKGFEPKEEYKENYKEYLDGKRNN